MKKLIAMICLTVMVLTVNSGCGNDDVALKEIRDRGKLKVGVKTDVPGFGFYDSSTKEHEGLEIDLARLIASDILGDAKAVEFIGVTAQTRGPMLENGELDMVIATFTITDERKEMYNFTQPYYHDEIGFLVRSESNIQSISDIGGKTIGIAQSGTAKSALEAESGRLGIELILSERASYPELKAALSSGEIDAFCVDKSILTGYRDDKTRILEDGFNPQDYGIATKLEKKQLAKYLDDYLASIMKDGKFEEILIRWDRVQ